MDDSQPPVSSAGFAVGSSLSGLTVPADEAHWEVC